MNFQKEEESNQNVHPGKAMKMRKIVKNRIGGEIQKEDHN